MSPQSASTRAVTLSAPAVFISHCLCAIKGLSVDNSATRSDMFRYDWTVAEVRGIYRQPFPDLIYEAQTIHRQHHSPNKIQRSSLLSLKTGDCPEDCMYCPQSAHYRTNIQPHGMLDRESVLCRAKQAKDEGSTRLCMGASWREIPDGAEFDEVLAIVRGVANLGLEVCCTMGMLTANQAARLKDAGCVYYNHNLDTSPEFYGNIITTRTYEERLETLRYVRAAGMKVCTGGIIGMGEGLNDRISLLLQLASQQPHPESVPINMLVRIEGTPLEQQSSVDPLEFVRVVATARILMPESSIRLSAGRAEMSDETQALCFLAGANSVFAGEKLLTTANAGDDRDSLLLRKLGMEYMKESEVEN